MHLLARLCCVRVSVSVHVCVCLRCYVWGGEICVRLSRKGRTASVFVIMGVFFKEKPACFCTRCKKSKYVLVFKSSSICAPLAAVPCAFCASWIMFLAHHYMYYWSPASCRNVCFGSLSWISHEPLWSHPRSTVNWRMFWYKLEKVSAPIAACFSPASKQVCAQICRQHVLGRVRRSVRFAMIAHPQRGLRIYIFMFTVEVHEGV